MASVDPAAKRFCINSKSTNVVKTVRFDEPSDIIVEIKDNKSLFPILDRLRKGDISHETMLRWFKQLEDNVLLLDELPPIERNDLVNTIAKLNWIWSKNEQVINGYCSLIECIVTFNVNYTSNVILPSVLSFFPKAGEADVSEVGVPSKEDKQQFDCVHKLLEAIVRMIPMAGQLLFQTLKERFPLDVCDRHKQACYIINMLQTTYYLSEFRRDTLAIIFERLKTIDMECPWNEIHEAEKISICESIPEDDTNVDSVVLKMNHKTANLLDVLMKEMFLYIDKNCCAESEMNVAKTKKLYRELLTLFDKQLVLSSGTCHLQFIMFYICRYHLRLCRGYIDYLWKQVNTNVSVEVRQSAAVYMGSFIVRHVAIPISTVRDCLLLMKNWIHYYIDKHGGSPRDQPENHDTFYAVCQAMFYVVTCRIEELMKMPDGPHFLSTLHLSSIVSSQLCPLRYCSPNVTQLFASKAKDYQLAYCYPYIIEGEADSAAPIVHHSFPFDPCLLARSSEFIEPIYRVFLEHFYGYPEEEEPGSEDETIDALFDDNSTQDSWQSSMFD